MKNNDWQKILYIPHSLQWAIGLGGVAILGLAMINYMFLPAYQTLKTHKRVIIELEQQTAILLASYQQKTVNYVLQQKVIPPQKIPRRPSSEIVLESTLPVMHWQLNEQRQEISLLLGWQQFLLFFRQIRELGVTQLPASLSLQTQENEIAVRIIYSLRKG